MVLFGRVGLTLLALAWLAFAASIGPRFVPVGQVSPLTNPADFRAFYCAGEAMGQGADPYLVEPLESCERREARAMGLDLAPGLVTPAPLPPYAIAAFVPISHLPFASAVCGWFASILLAIVGTVVALRGATRLPLVAILLVLASGAIAAEMLGQMMPIVLALLVVAAESLAAGRRSLCAGALALAMIEPHVALPAILALFVMRADVRVPLAVCGAALLLIALPVAGFGSYAEYFGRELPLHALSEVHALQAQDSLTTLLATLGHVSDRIALFAGEADYAVMIALGTWLAVRLGPASDRPRRLVYLPVACAALGGMFSHSYTFEIALPAALTLAAMAPRRSMPYWLAAAGICLGIVLDARFGEAIVHHGPAVLNAAPDALASGVSTAYQRSRMPVDPNAIALVLALKVPPVLGLLALVIAASRTALAAGARPTPANGLPARA
jgi:hypothetical protein